MANFRKNGDFFFFAEKNSEFTTRNKKVSLFLKVRRVGSQVHRKLFKSARIPNEEKLLGFLLGSACTQSNASRTQ